MLVMINIILIPTQKFMGFNLEFAAIPLHKDIEIEDAQIPIFSSIGNEIYINNFDYYEIIRVTHDPDYDFKGKKLINIYLKPIKLKQQHLVATKLTLQNDGWK